VHWSKNSSVIPGSTLVTSMRTEKRKLHNILSVVFVVVTPATCSPSRCPAIGFSATLLSLNYSIFQAFHVHARTHTHTQNHFGETKTEVRDISTWHEIKHFQYINNNNNSRWANYTDRVTATCWRSQCQFLAIDGLAWSAWRIPTAVFSDF
jgi:hypothetical protein